MALWVPFPGGRHLWFVAPHGEPGSSNQVAIGAFTKIDSKDNIYCFIAPSPDILHMTTDELMKLAVTCPDEPVRLSQVELHQLKEKISRERPPSLRSCLKSAGNAFEKNCPCNMFESEMGSVL